MYVVYIAQCQDTHTTLRHRSDTLQERRAVKKRYADNTLHDLINDLIIFFVSRNRNFNFSCVRYDCCVVNDNATYWRTLNRARQLYKNISMLFPFPVKTVSLLQSPMHNVSYISLQKSKITVQNSMHK